MWGVILALSGRSEYGFLKLNINTQTSSLPELTTPRLFPQNVKRSSSKLGAMSGHGTESMHSKEGGIHPTLESSQDLEGWTAKQNIPSFFCLHIEYSMFTLRTEQQLRAKWLYKVTISNGCRLFNMCKPGWHQNLSETTLFQWFIYNLWGMENILYIYIFWVFVII